MTALCGLMRAQAAKTITLRMIDVRSGKLIPTTNYLITIDHDPTVHANWVELNEDGSGKLTLPANAKLLSVQATYDRATEFFINCDSGPEHADSPEHWYEIAEILLKGIVAPNGCRKMMIGGTKVSAVAKPGEFIFYVRKRNWREQAQEFSSH
jgi:hypothetical protein